MLLLSVFHFNLYQFIQENHYFEWFKMIDISTILAFEFSVLSTK